MITKIPLSTHHAKTKLYLSLQRRSDELFELVDGMTDAYRGWKIGNIINTRNERCNGLIVTDGQMSFTGSACTTG
jgi:hypothetical protein